MADKTRHAPIQYDIKTLMILTAFVAVAVQLSVLIWAVLPVRLPYLVYGLHFFWTASWLAVVLAGAWILVQAMRQGDLDRPVNGDGELSNTANRKELRRQFMLAVGWGIMNQLLWLGFTLGVTDLNAQWFMGIVYLQVLPAAWVSHGLQFRRYAASPFVLLRVMYFANLVGFVLPLLSLPYSIARSL